MVLTTYRPSSYTDHHHDQLHSEPLITTTTTTVFTLMMIRTPGPPLAEGSKVHLQRLLIDSLYPQKREHDSVPIVVQLPLDLV